MEQFIRPRLKDLSQGARIAYVRGLRMMTQDELAGKLRFTDDRWFDSVTYLKYYTKAWGVMN